MTDWGRVYADNATAVAGLARGLDDTQLTTRVPGSPEWTVHEVIAHLAGGPADVVGGRMDGAPGPAWTERHVGERRGLPVDDLVAEMESHADAVGDGARDVARPAIVWDIAVHHADLHEALGLGAPAEHFWRPVLDGVAPMMLGELAVAAASVPPYEVFRGVFSRRSRRQMRAWDTGLADEQLDALCIFGPREDDQPTP